MIEVCGPGRWRVDYVGFPLAIPWPTAVVYAPGLDCDERLRADALEHQRYHEWYGTPCRYEHANLGTVPDLFAMMSVAPGWTSG